VRLAREERNWAEAERLQQVGAEWGRQRAAPLLARARESLDGNERNTVRSLAVGLHELGEIRRELGREACVASYEEGMELAESIGERAVTAACAFNLGHAYKDLSALRDLDQAVYWYRRSLELTDERDRLGRGRCLAQLGLVAKERFKDARARKAGADELLRHLNEAAGFYHQQLELTPPDAVHELAVAHNALGAIYGDAGDLDRALPHYRDSIRYEEAQGNLYGASQTRFNVAVDLAGAGRLQDALAYAEAALRGFESYGESAAEMIQRTRGLIEWIRRKNPP
jgi:tetratricopeptide (TPR) repeat protein